jgi:hypothetical protein
MDWSKRIKAGLMASTLCLPLGEVLGVESVTLYEGCWSGFKTKRVIQGAQAYPETLSHLPSNFEREADLHAFRKALSKFSAELNDFEDVYRASLSIAAKICPSRRLAIAKNLRTKFVAATKLYSELEYIYRLLNQVGSYRNNSQKLKLSVKNAKALKRKLED